MNTKCIKQQLSQLRLFTAEQELEAVLSEEKKAVSLNWISALLEREIEARRQKSLSKRIKKAKFPEITSIETFDWDFNPQIEQQEIVNLSSSSCNWIKCRTTRIQYLLHKYEKTFKRHPDRKI